MTSIRTSAVLVSINWVAFRRPPPLRKAVGISVWKAVLDRVSVVLVIFGRTLAIIGISPSFPGGRLVALAFPKAGAVETTASTTLALCAQFLRAGLTRRTISS